MHTLGAGRDAPPPWLPDEVALSGVRAASGGEVAEYERRAAFDPADELRLLLELGFSPNDTLVDLGAGPGQLALAAAPLAARVVAVDPAPAMTAYVARRAAELGLANVEAVQAGFLTYRHEGAPAGWVFTRNALHHLPDFWKVEALLGIARMLRPGEVLRLRDLVFSFPPEQAGERIAAWIDATSARGGWSRADLEAHVREEHSTYGRLLEPMLERAGFRIEGVSYDESAFYAAYTCRRR